MVLLGSLVGARTLYQEVARTLRQRIASGTLAAGTRLPSEASLAAQFAVSRATVREALRGLQAAGEIVLRAGRRYVAGTAATPDLAYERVAAGLRQQVRRLQRAADVQLPGGELQLAAEYGVSRPTVRKALDLLSQEGLVYSVPKVGWFVVAKPARSRRRDG